ncbi:unnamed protein product [Gadus morhua 'NCC']
MEPEMSKAVAMKCQGCWTDPRTGLTEGYMASGDSLVSLAYSYRLGHTKVRNSVHMVCAAIEKTMMERLQGTQSGDPNRLRSAALGDRPVGVGIENSTREGRPAMQYEVVNQREFAESLSFLRLKVVTSRVEAERVAKKSEVRADLIKSTMGMCSSRGDKREAPV